MVTACRRMPSIRLSRCSDVWHGFVERDSPEKPCRTDGHVLSAAAPTGRTWGDDAPTTKRFREMDTLSRAAQPARLFLCLPRAAPTTDAPRQRAPHAPPLASTGRPIHPWITALTGHREPRQGRPTPMTGRAGTRGMAWEPTQRRTALHARAMRSQAQPHPTRLLLGGRR